MPAHASHPLQLFDIDVFDLFKRVYGKLLEDRMIAGNNHIEKEEFLSLYPASRAKVFTPANICNSFANAGLGSIDQDRVLSKITFQLYTPTSSLVEGSIFSALVIVRINLLETQLLYGLDIKRY